MARILILIALLVLSGCGDESKDTPAPKDIQTAEGIECSNCTESRTFKANPELPLIIVEVFGRKNVSPDAQAIEDFLKQKVQDGVIQNLDILARGFEGGGQFCVTVAGSSQRAALLEELKAIDTDPSETSYGVESVSECRTPVP